jgi:PTS hybrid protein
MTVGLVVVSHSARLAEGVCEVAAQMAPDVRVLPAGGMADGGVGTDFEKVSAALAEANTGDGAVLLYDLGSAKMVAELAVESLGDPNSAIVAEGPFVEGAVAAAVAAQDGKTLADVARAAEAGKEPEAAASTEEEQQIVEELTLANEVGLHARPAALLARSLTGLQAKVSVALGDKEADAASVLGVMGLGARKGDRIVLRASGPDARQAIDRIFELAERNFDE